MDTSINREEVFAKKRDELFAKRLANDISRLESCGFQMQEIKRMIGTFSYVKAWCNTPNFLYPVLKLPKGHVWKNGQKFKCNYGKKGNIKKMTYVLLPVENDLYIKGVEISGTHKSDPKIAYIKDYKKLKDIEAAQHFDYNLSNIILKYWHDNDLPQGFIEPVTRDLKENQYVKTR